VSNIDWFYRRLKGPPSRKGKAVNISIHQSTGIEVELRDFPKDHFAVLQLNVKSHDGPIEINLFSNMGDAEQIEAMIEDLQLGLQRELIKVRNSRAQLQLELSNFVM
jgi:hypothetical protein